MIGAAKTHLRRLLPPLLPRNTFACGASVLVGGTAAAQLLTVLAANLAGPDTWLIPIIRAALNKGR